MECVTSQPMGTSFPAICESGSVQVAKVIETYKATRKEELSVDVGNLVFILIRPNLNDNAPEGHVTAKYGKLLGWIPNTCFEVEETHETLHKAALSGNLELLQVCLNNGLSPNRLDEENNTPLYWAACSGHIDCVKLLLKQHGIPINSQNKEGNTPLHTAALQGHKKIVKLLLEKGADSTIRNFAYKTPEDITPDPKIAKCLHKRGPGKQTQPGTNCFYQGDCYCFTCCYTPHQNINTDIVTVEVGEDGGCCDCFGNCCESFLDGCCGCISECLSNCCDAVCACDN